MEMQNEQRRSIDPSIDRSNIAEALGVPDEARRRSDGEVSSQKWESTVVNNTMNALLF